MDYETVFEITQKPFDWQFAAVGLLLAIAGLAVAQIGRRLGWRRSWFGYIMLAFGIFWSFAVSWGMYSEYRQLLGDYRDGNYQEVSGLVEDFQPMPYEGHRQECFRVQQTTFCYSDFGITAGFNNSASHGGPIRQGLPVRIAYRSGTILRVDVARGYLPSPTERLTTAAAAEGRWNNLLSTDPRMVKLNLGFAMAMMIMTLWWNLQWRRFMKFWIQPPNSERVQIGFRVFFAVSFAGALANVVRELVNAPSAINDTAGALYVGLICMAVITLMVHTVEWANKVLKGQKHD